MMKILSSLLIVLICAPLFALETEDDRILYLMKKVRDDLKEEYPEHSIYEKSGILYCTGESDLAGVNNRAADLMADGKWDEGIQVLEQGLEKVALFFPFRYNLGLAYFHVDELRKSLLNFRKAAAVVPEYPKTYLHMGNIHQRWYQDSEAIEYYRMALKRNRGELNTFILIGDLFLKRNQVELAKKYYDSSLSIDPSFPNGLLGRAKIHFIQGEYIKALNTLKAIDTRKHYDKSFHYYFAETSFKLKDYALASKHYAILLKHRNDRFFLTNSIRLIEHKLNLSRRFIEK